MNLRGLPRPSLAMRHALVSVALLLLAIVFVRPLTASMALHMLVHIPALLIAGMFAWRAAAASGGARNRFLAKVLRRYREYDEFGIPGLLLASFAGAYWMLPKALDQVQALPWAEVLKFFVLFILGMILLDSLARANRVVKLFFLGNFCWMAAIVGILYQDGSVRLCNFYLVDDQVLAGRGLLVLSIALPVLWLLSNWAAVRRFLRA
ncbi:hypothetical protein [Paralcaligenes ginsengisoli]|jgi:hypothetical protein